MSKDTQDHYEIHGRENKLGPKSTHPVTVSIGSVTRATLAPEQNGHKELPSALQEIFLNRLLVIGEGEQTYTGYPTQLMEEIEDYTKQAVVEARIEELRAIPGQTLTDDRAHHVARRLAELERERSE